MSTMSPTDSTTPPPAPAEHCGQCGAPAAPEQRYCVNCGFHRRNAPDPVARYLSEASAARARVAAAAAFAARRRRPRVGMRLVASLVALALLIGIVIGGALAGGSTPRRPGSTSTSGAAQATVQHSAEPKATTKLKRATGSSYLQQEQNLPNTVTP